VRFFHIIARNRSSLTFVDFYFPVARTSYNLFIHSPGNVVGTVPSLGLL
jgi:hypothetical protein